MNSKKSVKKTFMSIFITTVLFLSVTGVSINSCTAHILVIGDPGGDLSENYYQAVEISQTLRSKGYNVLELYRDKATSENILKGMYGSDAIIYTGHGMCLKENLGSRIEDAKPPFSIQTADGALWSIDGKFRVGFTKKLVTPPLKAGEPVIFLNTCFSCGRVQGKELNDPIAAIYQFSKTYTCSGANYYATSWKGAEIVYDFINGAKNFQEANDNNYEPIKKSTTYNGETIWRNDHGYCVFIGDWNSGFPKPENTKPYNEAEAQKWYNNC